MDYQNTAVPSATLKRRVKFIKEWLEENWLVYFDDIEIIEDLEKLRLHVDQITREHIEKYLECRSVEGTKYKNQPIGIERKDCELQKLMTEHIFSSSKYSTDLNIKHIISKYIKIFTDINKFKRGPRVDFSIYEQWEVLFENNTNLSHLNTQESNITTFYNNVLPQLIKTNINYANDPTRIIAFIHGSLIRSIWKTIDKGTYAANMHQLEGLMNTAVVREIRTYDQFPDKLNYVNLEVPKSFKGSEINFKYQPEKIRATDFGIYEKTNTNVCATQSIKGILNYNLAETPGVGIFTGDKVYNDVGFVYKPKYVPADSRDLSRVPKYVIGEHVQTSQIAGRRKYAYKIDKYINKSSQLNNN